jgi:hypothetical protein
MVAQLTGVGAPHGRVKRALRGGREVDRPLEFGVGAPELLSEAGQLLARPPIFATPSALARLPFARPVEGVAGRVARLGQCAAHPRGARHECRAVRDRGGRRGVRGSCGQDRAGELAEDLSGRGGFVPSCATEGPLSALARPHLALGDQASEEATLAPTPLLGGALRGRGDVAVGPGIAVPRVAFPRVAVPRVASPRPRVWAAAIGARALEQALRFFELALEPVHRPLSSRLHGALGLSPREQSFSRSLGTLAQLGLAVGASIELLAEPLESLAEVRCAGCQVLGCRVLGCRVLGCRVLGCRVLGCASLGLPSPGPPSPGLRSLGSGPRGSPPQTSRHRPRFRGRGLAPARDRGRARAARPTSSGRSSLRRHPGPARCADPGSLRARARAPRVDPDGGARGPPAAAPPRAPPPPHRVHSPSHGARPRDPARGRWRGRGRRPPHDASRWQRDAGPVAPRAPRSPRALRARPAHGLEEAGRAAARR